MKILLLLSLITLLFQEEPSYNFGGRFTKADGMTLLIDVRDGSYWATFSGKSGSDSSSCELSGKASVVKGRLHVDSRQGKQSLKLLISAADHTNKMVVRMLRKVDKASLTNNCPDGGLITGDYTRIL